MQLTNLAVWAIDHIFGAGTSEHFVSDLQQTAALLISGDPSLSQQAVAAKLESDAGELIQNCIGVKNTFALFLLDSLIDNEIAGIVAAAYAKLGVSAASGQPAAAAAS
jgi:hypothetical protein